MRIILNKIWVEVGPNLRLIEVTQKGKELYAEGVIAIATDDEVKAAKQAFDRMDCVEAV